MVPLVVCSYRAFLPRRRLRDLMTNLGDHEAIEACLAPFTPLPPSPDRGDAEQDRIVEGKSLEVHHGGHYLWRLSVLCAALCAAVVAVFLWAEASPPGGPGSARDLHLAVVLALCGACVWTVFALLTRAVRRDLVPSDPTGMTLRLVACVPIGHAFSPLAIARVEALLAIAAAAFPLRPLQRFFRERALEKPEAVPAPSASLAVDGHLRATLDGIGDDHIVRLEELGISAHDDLASADPLRIRARTGWSMRLLAAWTDQALLAVDATSHEVALARALVPRALGAREFRARHVPHQDEAPPIADPKEREADGRGAVQAPAARLDVAPGLLVGMLRAVCEDPHVSLLARTWYARVAESGRAASP
jgi:hypothetical protein